MSVAPLEVRLEAVRISLIKTCEAFEEVRAATQACVFSESLLASHNLLAVCAGHVMSVQHLLSSQSVSHARLSVDCLVRSILESSVFAFWILEPEDWQVREHRWIRYAENDLRYNKRMRVELPEAVGAFDDHIQWLQERVDRVKDSLKANSSQNDCDQRFESVGFAQALRECSLVSHPYFSYRSKSHSLHGGLGPALSALEISDGRITVNLGLKLDDWVDVTWSIAKVFGPACNLYAKRAEAGSDGIRKLEVTGQLLFYQLEELLNHLKLKS